MCQVKDLSKQTLLSDHSFNENLKFIKLFPFLRTPFYKRKKKEIFRKITGTTTCWENEACEVLIETALLCNEWL